MNNINTFWNTLNFIFASSDILTKITIVLLIVYAILTTISLVLYYLEARQKGLEPMDALSEITVRHDEKRVRKMKQWWDKRFSRIKTRVK